MAKTCTKDGHKQTIKTSTKIQTKRTKKHRTTEEEMEGPTSPGGSRNRLTCLNLQEHDDDDEILCFKKNEIQWDVKLRLKTLRLQ